jgi:sulfatase modifying factor 1
MTTRPLLAAGLAAILIYGTALGQTSRAARYEAWRAAHREVDPRTAEPGTPLWECAVCPEMVVAPAGAFTIGSPEDEPGRGKDEGPQRKITIGAPLAVGRFEVTRGEYEAFLSATGHPVSGNCVTDRARHGTWAPDSATTLRYPGFSQTNDHPVVCVTWDDAQAYIAWLNGQTSGGYRLPTEAEWEYLARAGSTAAYPWGPSPDTGCRYANVADETKLEDYPDWVVARCRDGAKHTMPVGSYAPNDFGLYDMIGNTGEWVQDCASDSYADLPADGTARGGDCTRHLVRSGSWGTITKDTRVANRVRYPTLLVDDSVGIRLVRTLR